MIIWIDRYADIQPNTFFNRVIIDTDKDLYTVVDIEHKPTPFHRDIKVRGGKGTYRVYINYDYIRVDIYENRERVPLYGQDFSMPLVRIIIHGGGKYVVYINGYEVATSGELSKVGPIFTTIPRALNPRYIGAVAHYDFVMNMRIKPMTYPTR